jgi:hypothetical protein
MDQMARILRTVVLLFQGMAALAISAGMSRLEAETPSVTMHAERMGPGTVVVRLPAAVTLHGVGVELYDADGNRLSRRSDWRVELFHGARLRPTAAEPMALLSADDPDLQLPRPFGVRLGAEDSLLVVATLSADDAIRGVMLQVTLEYESKGSPVTRLPVLSLSSQSGDSTAPGRWSLRSAVAGRLVAISGRLLACAEEIVLEDVETGRVVWRTRVAEPFTGRDADQRAEVVRPGVTVEAGRTYELRATRSVAGQGCGEAAPHAVLLPR